MPSLSALHDCPKCHGKIVGVGLDNVGRISCGYCGQAVDYAAWNLEEDQE